MLLNTKLLIISIILILYLLVWFYKNYNNNSNKTTNKIYQKFSYNSNSIKIFVYGYLHHKNKIALDLISKYVTVVYLNNINDIFNYDNKNSVLIITDSFVNIEFPNIIYGPHIDFVKMINYCRNYNQTDKEIKINTLSNWQSKLSYSLVNKKNVNFVDIPFPVDTDKFIPKEKLNQCFIYIKRAELNRIELGEKILGTLNMDYKIFTYKYYTEQDYLDYISQSKFGIWIGSHESQGFALQEALSCNCPLFVLDVTSLKDEYEDGNFHWKNTELSDYELEATSASYWDKSCGIICKSKDYNKVIVEFNIFLKNLNTYSPRDFILKNLSISKFIQNINSLIKD